MTSDRLKTRLLQDAFSQIADLPASKQDAVAALVMEELAYEGRWSSSFANSQDLLAKRAEEALGEHAAGQTKPL